MTVKELKDYIFDKYYRQIGFPKESYYQSSLKIDNYSATKNYRKPVIIDHPKTYKISKATRQGEEVSQLSIASKSSDSPLYCERKKVKAFWMKKMQK